MRLSRGFAVGAGFILLVPAVLSSGCFALDEDCSLVNTCPPLTGGNASTSGGGGGPITLPECIPSEAKGPVADTCGVFVASSTGDDANSGTKATPVATLAKAIELSAGQKPIYACAETFNGAIVVPAGVEIYGGLDCKMGWSYSEAGRTLLTAAADEVPLKLSSGVSSTRLENLSVTALSATKASGSSIAAIIDNVPAEITRCDFAAGNGADGLDGEIPMILPEMGMPGTDGSNTCDPPVGGTPGMTSCGLDMSVGGIGGKGGTPTIGLEAGEAGGNGEPTDAVTGLGGAGAAAIPGAICQPGGGGKDGDGGTNGLGGTTPGTVSIAGYVGVDGAPGEPGKPGQGGGGGGGYKMDKLCGTPAMDGPGPSGGGGGSGGCGGLGGTGGKAGGSSIGIISLNATITASNLKITTGNGGKGGAGSIGGAGGQGGDGGLGGKPANVAGSKAACKGGDGGYGGAGGSSGGGHGGHAIGIAYTGAAAPDASNVETTLGTPGDGGLGASGDPSGDGANGMAGKDPVQFQ